MPPPSFVSAITGVAGAALGAATRVTSDFIPAVRISHHIYAAWAWAIGGCIWLIALGNMFLREGDDEKPKPNCPGHAAETSG